MNWYQEKIRQYRDYLSTKRIVDTRILYLPFAFALLKLFARACAAGLRVCIFETYRSQERQLELFNQKRTQLKKNGMHHFGIATDIVFRDERNQPIWNGNWDALGQIGRNLGLFWGGDWTAFVDKPHFQLVRATLEEQAKVINGQYPPYDSKIDADLETLFPLYEEVVRSNYAAARIDQMLAGLQEIESPRPVPRTEEPVELPRPPVEDRTAPQPAPRRKTRFQSLIELILGLFKRR